MNSIIHKYEITYNGLTNIRVSKNAKILCVKESHGKSFVYVQMDNSKEEKDIILLSVFTDVKFDDTGFKYIGTTVDSNGMAEHIYSKE